MRRSRFFLNSSLGVVMAAGVRVELGSVPFVRELSRADEKLNPDFYALAG